GFPDLPTIAEAGVAGYSAPTWAGVIAPKGLPPSVVEKLNVAINRAIRSQSVRQFYANVGDEPAGGTPEEFAALIAADSQKGAEVITRGGIRLKYRLLVPSGPNSPAPYCDEGKNPCPAAAATTARSG